MEQKSLCAMPVKLITWKRADKWWLVDSLVIGFFHTFLSNDFLLFLVSGIEKGERGNFGTGN
jgi:hypothetical protein